MKHNFTRLCASWVFLLALFLSNDLHGQCICTGGLLSNPAPLYPDMDCETHFDLNDLDDLIDCTGPYFITVRELGGNVIIADSHQVVVDLAAYVGEIISVQIESIGSNDECFSYYEVMDAIRPTINCPFDTVSCLGFPDSVRVPEIIDNCNATLTGPADVPMFLNCTVTGFYKRVLRTYVAIDDSGNRDTCVQEVLVTLNSLSDIGFPRDTSLACNDNFDTSITGLPTLFGMPFTNGLDCNLQLAPFVDDTVSFSNCNSLVRRAWAFTDDCTGAIRLDTQIIRLVDTIPPAFTFCSPMYSFPADQNCNADPIVPIPDATDNCSGVDIQAFTNAQTGTLTSTGFQFTGLTEGIYPLTFIATDSCGLMDTCESSIRINDLTTPTAVCKGTLIVSLNNMGMADLDAVEVNGGSSDACGGPLDFMLSRTTMDFAPSVKFTCVDLLADSIMVTLQVIDVTNTSSTNICMTWVKVMDKLAPILVCPANDTVSCGFDYADLEDLVFEMDGCDYRVDMVSVFNVDNCGNGTITRTWTAIDSSGNDFSCSQIVTVENDNPFDGTGIVWPADHIATNACTTLTELEPDDLPSGSDRPVLPDVNCAMLMTSFSDQMFYIDFPSCYKIVRTWKVIDWCQYDPNALIPVGKWQNQQVIAVMDNNPPNITFCPPADTFSLNADCTFGFVEMDSVEAIGLCANEDITITNNSPHAFANGPDAGGNYPEGVHVITYSIEDGCGNKVTCSTTITVADLKPPTPYCKEGIIAELQFMPNGSPNVMAVVNAHQLNDGSFDNCTDPTDLVFTLRQVGISAPPTETSQVFDCTDVGITEFEIWVIDEAGNMDVCITEIEIQDNMFECPDDDTLSVNNGTIAGEITTVMDEQFPEVNVDIAAINMSYLTDNEGRYEFTNLGTGNDYTIEPWKNDGPKDGVTTYDIVLMTRHVLNILPIVDPYKLIAADVNNSGSVTTYDIVELRKMILGINQAFPTNNSWRFVIASHVFSDPSNPFDPPFPEAIHVNNLTTGIPNANFVGVKIGDINNSASVNYNDIDDRNSNELNILTDDRDIAEGETFTIPFRLERENNLLALQFTLEFETDLELQGIEKGTLSSVAGDRFTTSQYREGIMTGTWYHTSPVNATTEDALFSLRFRSNKGGKLSEMIALTSRITEAVVYDGQESEFNLNLAFTNPSNMQTDQSFQLHQNQPNPFRRVTNIAFTLPEASPAKLTIYDVSGNVLKTYEKSGQPGYNEVSIMRQELPTGGVLFYKLQTPKHTATKKMILLQ